MCIYTCVYCIDKTHTCKLYFSNLYITYMCVGICIYVCIYVFECMNINTYIYIYIYIYIRVCIFVSARG